MTLQERYVHATQTWPDSEGGGEAKARRMPRGALFTIQLATPNILPSRPLKEAYASARNRPDSHFRTATDLGWVRRFGPRGVPYEVIAILSPKEVRIRVLTTGEEVDYGIADLLNDPEDRCLPSPSI